MQSTTLNNAVTRRIDEDLLETDPGYRFEYLTKVLDLAERDRSLLRKHYPQIQQQIHGVIDRIYEKMFQFDAMKRHFLPRNDGFDGDLPDSMAELTLDHQQTVFRKMQLQGYFEKFCTAQWDETFAILIDMVGRMHTPREGNSGLAIPVVQITAMLGVMNDLLLEMIAQLNLSDADKLGLERTFTKLFWIQNCMFIRHWTTKQ